MTVIRFARPAWNESETKASAWHCDLCHCFHVRAEEVLLSFSVKEFAAFTEEVVDCFSTQALHAESSEDVDYAPDDDRYTH